MLLTRLREERVCPRAVVVADRVLQQPMRQDDVRSREVFASVVALDHIAAVMQYELQPKRTDGRAGHAATGRCARHVEQAVGEFEVAGLDQLDEPLTFPKRLGVRIAEDGVAFELYEPHGRREPLADERGQFVNYLVGGGQLGAGKER